MIVDNCRTLIPNKLCHKGKTFSPINQPSPHKKTTISPLCQKKRHVIKIRETPRYAMNRPHSGFRYWQIGSQAMVRIVQAPLRALLL